MSDRSSSSAAEAKVWEPSTFASRGAARPPRPRRLVSMGRTEHWLTGVGRNPEARIVEVDIVADLDSGKWYASEPGSNVLQPLVKRTSPAEEVLDRFSVRKRPAGFAPMTANPSKPDEVRRPFD